MRRNKSALKELGKTKERKEGNGRKRVEKPKTKGEKEKKRKQESVPRGKKFCISSAAGKKPPPNESLNLPSSIG
jgi:hypothetical protein